MGIEKNILGIEDLGQAYSRATEFFELGARLRFISRKERKVVHDYMMTVKRIWVQSTETKLQTNQGEIVYKHPIYLFRADFGFSSEGIRAVIVPKFYMNGRPEVSVATEVHMDIDDDPYETGLAVAVPHNAGSFKLKIHQIPFEALSDLKNLRVSLPEEGVYSGLITSLDWRSER